MKKLLAMFAVFGLVALVAAYVALAPLSTSGPGAVQTALAFLDEGAARISAIAGRSEAVLALLGSGMVLGLIAALAVGKSSATPQDEDVTPAPGPVWRPEPHSHEDRIAGLRRRASGTTASEPDYESPVITALVDETEYGQTADAQACEAAEPEVITAERPRPVILVRKARERTRDWTWDLSWLGGLPRLGSAPWPRDSHGTPLPFAAQVNLSELAGACAESPLPHSGSLAFFLGEGAVVAVSPGEHDFTDPPADLPPAYEEDGTPLPSTPTRLSRYLFPFWPVEPVVEPGDEEPGPSTLQEHGMTSAALAEVGEDNLWWYGVFHLTDQLREALDGAQRDYDAELSQEGKAKDALAALEARGDALPEAVAGARRKIHDIDARLREIEEQASEMPAMIEALEGFSSGRGPWEPMTEEERGLVTEILGEIHARHGKLVEARLPHALAPLRALCIRAMATGAPKAFAALPDDLLEKIAGNCAVPPRDHHRIFTGPAHGSQDDDLLLLQLASDDMMEWRWDNLGRYQFRIDRKDALGGNWQNARLIFEPA